MQHFTGIVTTTAALSVLSQNEEFLYLLKYEEDEILGSCIKQIFDSEEDLSWIPGEKIIKLKRSDGTLLNAVVRVADTLANQIPVFIWYFDEIVVQTCQLNLDENGNVLNIAGECPNMLKLPINAGKMLVNDHCTVNIDNGYSFPVSIQQRITKTSLLISCTPNIAGLILTKPDGSIHTISNELSLALFGFEQSELLGVNISLIIPTFKDCLRKLDNEDSDELSTCVLNGKHKDSGLLKLSVQCRKILLEDEPYYAGWVLYQKHNNEVSIESEMDSLSFTHRSPSSLGLSNLNELPIPKKRVSFSGTPQKPEPKPQSPPNFPSILLDQSISLRQEDFDLIEALGEGSFSFIKLCIYKNDPEKIPVVIKFIIRSKILSWYRRDGKNIPTELAVLNELYHNHSPHVPKIRASFQDEFYYCLVMEYSPSIDLFELIEQNCEFMDEDKMKMIFRQVLDAVRHLHSIGIVHRDIKDENVLIDTETNHVTLIDFGSSAFCNSGPFHTFYGTNLYAPPEVLEGERYEGKAQDMWQLGILLYVLSHRDTPFFSVQEILDAKLTFSRPTISDELKDLMLKLLDRNESTRLTISQAIDHPWFA